MLVRFIAFWFVTIGLGVLAAWISSLSHAGTDWTIRAMSLFGLPYLLLMIRWVIKGARSAPAPKAPLDY